MQTALSTSIVLDAVITLFNYIICSPNTNGNIHDSLSSNSVLFFMVQHQLLQYRLWNIVGIASEVLGCSSVLYTSCKTHNRIKIKYLKYKSLLLQPCLK